MKLLRVFLLLSAMMVFVACSNESDDYSYTGALPIPQNLAYELIKQQLGDKQLNGIDIYVSIDMLSAKTKVVIMGSEDIISPDCDSWLFFVDEMPLIANCGHPCKYIFVDETGNVFVYERTMFPTEPSMEKMNLLNRADVWDGYDEK